MLLTAPFKLSPNASIFKPSMSALCAPYGATTPAIRPQQYHPANPSHRTRRSGKKYNHCDRKTKKYIEANFFQYQYPYLTTVYNQNVNHQASFEILQSLKGDNHYPTIPQWEKLWMNHGYIFPKATNDVTMLVPDENNYWRYFQHLIQQSHYQQHQLQPQQLNQPTMISSIYSSQQQQFYNYPLLSNSNYSQRQQPMTPYSFYKLPPRGNQSVTIIDPNTREQIKRDPVYAKSCKITTKIQNPSVKENQSISMDNKKQTSTVNKKQSLFSTSNNEGKTATDFFNEEYDKASSAPVMNNDDNDNAPIETEMVSDEEERSSEDDIDDDKASTVTTLSTVENSQEKENTIFDNNEQEQKKSTRIQYDRDFLLQFRHQCTTTTSDLSMIPTVTSFIKREQVSEKSSNSTSLLNTLRPRKNNYFNSFNFDKETLSATSWRCSSTSILDLMATNQQQKRQPEPLLPKSVNRWVPPAELREKREKESNINEQIDTTSNQHDKASIEDIERKIKGLLNKLSPGNFDSISEQIWDLAKESSTTLKIAVHMIFHKACDEPVFATNWAKLSRKIHDSLSAYPAASTIQDPTITKDSDKPVSGVYLYRCYLLNKCQEQFELGWSTDIDKVEMLSDAYYAAMKQKRQGLGLVVFIGELYKQDMLGSRVLSGCLSRLVKEKNQVSDEEIETVCKLLATVGQPFDAVAKTKFWMNEYIHGLEEIIKTNKNLSTRVKFKVMDIIDLHKRRWISTKQN